MASTSAASVSVQQPFVSHEKKEKKKRKICKRRTTKEGFRTTKSLNLFPFITLEHPQQSAKTESQSHIWMLN